MKRISIALFLSLLFHLSQFGLVTYFPVQVPAQNETPPIEFEVVETPPTPKKINDEARVVKTIQEQKPLDMNTPAQFLAEKTNRARTQTQVQNHGQFNNSHQQPQQPRRPSQLDANGEQFSQQLNLPSRSEFKLPEDIKYGNATNLNTDAYLYASFYTRVMDLFYIRWAQKLDNTWSRMSDEAKRNLAGQYWSTDVEILLKPDGEYVEGRIMKKSGFSPFDSAAIFAFQDARFFPNPPKAKVEKDGKIHLRYRVTVQVR